MAYEGILANALVTAVAACAFLFVAQAVRVRRLPAEPRALTAVLLFATIGVHLALAAVRQVVAYFGVRDPGLAALEQGIFYVTVLPAALAIVPLGYMATWALTGKERVARGAGLFFVAAIAVGYAFILAGGIDGPHRTYWGSEFEIRSLVAKAMILLVLTIPAFVAGALLVRVGRGDDASARRARLVGWCCLLYYGAFTLDALGLEEAWLLGERIVMAGAAFLGYRAYFGAGATDSALDAAREATPALEAR